MFGNTSLEEIDMSNFYATELLTSIESMFYGCEKLKKVNISSLSRYDVYNEPIIRDAKYAFSRCTALESVELCDLTKCYKYKGMFADTPQNVKLDKEKLPKEFKWELKDKD